MRRCLMEFLELTNDKKIVPKIRFNIDKRNDIVICEFYLFDKKEGKVIESSLKRANFWDYAEGYKLFQEKKLDKLKEYIKLGGKIQIENANEGYKTIFSFGDSAVESVTSSNCFTGIMRAYDYFKEMTKKKSKSIEKQ